MSERIPRKSGQPAKSDKHSDLYTDEDPKGTIHGLKFATPEDAKASVSKIKSSGRSHAHKIQAAIAMEQRAKVMGKAGAAAVYRSFINSMKDKTEEMREATDLKDRFKKYIKPTVKTTPKMERIVNPAGRTTDHVEYKVTGPTGMVHRFKSKREAQAHYSSFTEQEMWETWSQKYKKSIDCSNPKGFSQKAHCQGRKKKMKEHIEEAVKMTALEKFRKAAAEREKKHAEIEKNRSKDGSGLTAAIDRLSKQVNKEEVEQIVDNINSPKDNINYTHPRGVPQQHTHVAKHNLDFGDGHVVKKGSQLRMVSGSKQMYVHLKNGKPVKDSYPLLNIPHTHVTDIKEEVEQIDEISDKLAGNYLKKVNTNLIKKVGMKPDLYNHLEPKRQKGATRALNRLMKPVEEDSPTNAAGTGAIAGLGVGPQGEPGVNMKKKKKVIPFAMFVRKMPD